LSGEASNTFRPRGRKLGEMFERRTQRIQNEAQKVDRGSWNCCGRLGDRRGEGSKEKKKPSTQNVITGTDFHFEKRVAELGGDVKGRGG